MSRPKNNPFYQDEVVFEEKEHTYTVKKTGQRLLSVSTLVKKFSNPFDPTGSVIANCAAKEGIQVEELRKRWDAKRDNSCLYGSSVHASLEHYIKNGEVKDDVHKDIVENFKSKVKIRGQPFSEVLLYSIEDGIAGTTDLIEYFPKDNSTSIKDLKTNEKIKKWGFKGQRMLPPLSHLQDGNLLHYTIQISLYCYLLDKRGFWINEDDLCLFWVNPATRKIEIIPLEYRRADVINMLDYWKKNFQKNP